MQKAPIVVFLAAAAGFGGGLLTRLLEDEASPVRRQDAARPPPVAEAPIDPARLAALEARLAVLEEARRAPAGGPSSSPAAAGTPAEAGSQAPAEEASDELPEDPLEGLLGKRFGNAEADRLFWRLQQQPGRIDATVARLEKLAKENPKDPEIQVALATAYVAKLTTLPAGPQQGLIWAQASAAYDRAIVLDPGHWQARFGKAFGISMAPEFLGMRPAAIKQFEELVEIQETKARAPEHVHAYYRLGTLYKDAGNAKKARETWERGLRMFPGNQTLKEALELLDAR